MNKTRITRFISKYNLAGMVESVTWNTDGQKLNTRFIADDKTVLGEIILDKINFRVLLLKNFGSKKYLDCSWFHFS